MPRKKKTRSSNDKPKLVARLRRIEGQSGAIARMIDRGADCSAILTQIAAARAALLSAARALLTEHLRALTVGSVRGRSEAALRQLDNVLAQFVK